MNLNEYSQILNTKNLKQLEERLKHIQKRVIASSNALEAFSTHPKTSKLQSQVFNFLKKQLLLEDVLNSIFAKLDTIKQQFISSRKNRKFSQLKTLTNTFSDLLIETELFQEMHFQVAKLYFQYLHQPNSNKQTQWLAQVA